MEEMKQKDKSIRESIVKICLILMSAIGTVIALFLSYYSFFYTQYMVRGCKEIPFEIRDNFIMNILALLFLIGLFLLFNLIEKKCSKKTCRVAIISIMSLSALVILGMGIWWINVLDHIPEGDQAFVYGGASYFIEGDYCFLGKGCYCNFYPYQLGIIAVVEGIFRIIGTYNYHGIQLIIVVLAAITDVVGFGILKEMGARFSTKMIYGILMMGCIPLIGYTSRVYGDLPSVCFIFIAVYFLLLFHRKEKWIFGAMAVASLVLSTLVRKNTMIFLVAFGIMSVLYLIKYKKSKMFITFVVTVVCCVLAYQSVYFMYEKRSGIEHGEGLPTNSWIAMGMQETYGAYGWYNDMPKQVGASYDWDVELTKNHMKELIRSRLIEFKNNPSYAVQFYKMKILTQWNEPLYECIFFNNYQGEEPDEGTFLYELFHEESGVRKVLFPADRWQFLVFFGTLLYFITVARDKKNPMNHVLAVTVIGSFFFSILWEANTRYVFPAYMMMYPLAVIGYEKSLDLLLLFFEKRSNKKKNTAK